MTPLSVGFIGLEDQGRPMATAIAQAGFPLHVWARRPGSLDALTGVPHRRHETLPAFAAAADAVALCVSNDEDVVRLRAGDLLGALRPGSVVVNHGTETRATPCVSPGCAPGVVSLRHICVTDQPLTQVLGGAAGGTRRLVPLATDTQVSSRG